MTTPCYYCERPEDHCKSCIHSDTYGEPKPLSDEEILNIAFCSEIDTVAIENDWNGTVLQFAREILKKASEK